MAEKCFVIINGGPECSGVAQLSIGGSFPYVLPGWFFSCFATGDITADNLLRFLRSLSLGATRVGKYECLISPSYLPESDGNNITCLHMSTVPKLDDLEHDDIFHSNDIIRGSLHFDKKGNLILAEFIMLPHNFGNPGGYTIRISNGKLTLKYYNGTSLSTLFHKGHDRDELYTFSGLEKRVETDEFASCKPSETEQATFDIHNMTLAQAFTMIRNYFNDPSLLKSDISFYSIVKIKIMEASGKNSEYFFELGEASVGNNVYRSYDVNTEKDGDISKLRFYFSSGRLISACGIVYHKEDGLPVVPLYAVSFADGSLRVSYYSESLVNSAITLLGSFEQVFVPDFESHIKLLNDCSLLPPKNYVRCENLTGFSLEEIISKILKVISGGTATCREFVEKHDRTRHSRRERIG